ncbi:MAG TPA: M20/M25/M40 family metallo-hydrolase [Steroidobacteraceae bacterium]|jgi:hippurate hydrolase|nr:M20/M25/M40 family metallo-hydrolase [Steroidobacteraceae bacterium]
MSPTQTMSPTLLQPILAELPALRALRRDLHAHPELSFEEQRTSELIARTLTGWGIPVHRGIGGTGLVGVIEHGKGGAAVGLRADMDALPVSEHNTFAHASTHAGRMHACGHDGHVAMLLAAARYWSQRRDFDGTVYLIFQPAEEAGRRRAPDDRGWPVRSLPDAGGVRRAQLARHGRRTVRAADRAGVCIQQ